MDFYSIRTTILSLRNVYRKEDIIDLIIELYQAHIINLNERNILINMIWRNKIFWLKYIKGGRTMIIFRHHKGTLNESMKTCKEFNDFEELQKYIIQYMKPHMNLVLSDVVASNEKTNDVRIGWEDSDYICIAGYNKVSDKKGFERYFGGKYESDLCVGMFATKYTK